jgi:hypothetical protein
MFVPWQKNIENDFRGACGEAKMKKRGISFGGPRYAREFCGGLALS